ncbi:MAG: hypothetical protein HYZ42_11060 [Bacteroidetes bacterium]|nr:hypothetical protein [Bacteroidota bacterium]
MELITCGFDNCTSVGVDAALANGYVKVVNSNFNKCATGFAYSEGKAPMLIYGCSFVDCGTGLYVTPDIGSSPMVTIRCSQFSNSILSITQAAVNMSRNTASSFLINTNNAASYYHGGKNVFSNSTINLDDAANWYLSNGETILSEVISL